MFTLKQLDEYLNTPVITNQNTPMVVTNISDEDYTFEWNLSETDEKGDPMPPEVFTIQTGDRLSLPKVIAMHAAIGLARKIEYSKCKDKKEWKGSVEAIWKPICVQILSGSDVVDTTVKKINEKSKGEKLREEVTKLNLNIKEDGSTT